MNSKAIRKQLLAAVAMVLVAAVALGSSTYAWFANSNSVEATGMAVNAATEGGIEIAAVTNGAAGDYATIASASMQSISLLPTSTNDTARWVSAVAKVSTDKTAVADTYKVISPILSNDVGSITESEVTKNYYVVKTFNIRPTAESLVAKDLKIDEVKVTNSTIQNLSKALRVAVVIGETDPIFYAPAGGDDEISVWEKNNTGENGAVTPVYFTTPVTNHDGKTAVNSTLTDAIPYEGVNVKIFLYFEGEDTNLKSENIEKTMETLNITVTFSAGTEAAPTQTTT